MTASPVGKPFGWVVSRICLHSSRICGPPIRWIAPSTPPPPSSVELAALTIAITSCAVMSRSEEHTSELQSRLHLVCRLLLEKKKKIKLKDILYQHITVTVLMPLHFRCFTIYTNI